MKLFLVTRPEVKDTLYLTCSDNRTLVKVKEKLPLCVTKYHAMKTFLVLN